MAQTTSRPLDANNLKLGNTYRATTSAGSATGEYLGMETPYGEWSILLRHRAGTESIAVNDVLMVEHQAA